MADASPCSASDLEDHFSNQGSSAQCEFAHLASSGFSSVASTYLFPWKNRTLLGNLAKQTRGVHQPGRAMGSAPGGPGEGRATCLCLGACVLLLLVLQHSVLVPSQPNRKACFWGPFKDAHGTFLLLLRKVFVFRLLRVLTPRPCFRVRE